MKYLLNMLTKRGTDRFVVISDIQDMVPAFYVFKFASQWEVVYLDTPYQPDNTFNAKNNVVRMEDYIDVRDSIQNI